LSCEHEILFGPFTYVADLPSRKDFALLVATASSSLLFTAPLLAAEHFRLLALRCGTVCHWKLREHRLWRVSVLISRWLSSL